MASATKQQRTMDGVPYHHDSWDEGTMYEPRIFAAEYVSTSGHKFVTFSLSAVGAEMLMIRNNPVRVGDFRKKGRVMLLPPDVTSYGQTDGGARWYVREVAGIPVHRIAAVDLKFDKHNDQWVCP